MKADGVRIPVISTDKLIKMKKATCREIDKMDVDNLKRIKKLRNKK